MPMFRSQASVTYSEGAMDSNIRNFALFSFLFVALNSQAQSNSCAQDAKDKKGLETCAQSEIYPLEEKVSQSLKRIQVKHSGNQNLTIGLQSSKSAWDTYRNNHCMFEAEALGSAKQSELEMQRAFMLCVKRLLEQRISELERF
jgi:uncharacterized protein YecT (DUF1311 family)